MFKLRVLLSVQRHDVTNETAGCVVFIMMFSQPDFSLVLRQSETLVTGKINFYIDKHRMCES